jgi:hypothetical protein
LIVKFLGKEIFEFEEVVVNKSMAALISAWKKGDLGALYITASGTVVLDVEMT